MTAGRADSQQAPWTQAASLIAAQRALLLDHPERRDPTRPTELQARNWDGFLRALSDAELDRLESGGLAADWPAQTPATLLALLAELRRVSALPALDSGQPPSDPAPHQGLRKQRQVAAFSQWLAPILQTLPGRIIDVGSGHGHLTRALAIQLARPVLGLDRSGPLVARAEALAQAQGAGARFARHDVLNDTSILAPGDSLIGLHACGALGDRMVEQAGDPEQQIAAVALVGCCLQKRPEDPRVPLSGQGTGLAEACTLPKSVLGLSNLSPGDQGVEASRRENLAARERRLALRRLLAAEGLVLGPGEEIKGLNRRAAHQDLQVLVERAFQVRQRPQPSAAAVVEAQCWARIEHRQRRRDALPRQLLGRALEIFVLHDRARYLEERGFQVRVGVLFGPEVSARNLALVAVRIGAS